MDFSGESVVSDYNGNIVAIAGKNEELLIAEVTFTHTHDGSTHEHTITHVHDHAHYVTDSKHGHHHTMAELEHEPGAAHAG